MRIVHPPVRPTVVDPRTGVRSGIFLLSTLQRQAMRTTSPPARSLVFQDRQCPGPRFERGTSEYKSEAL
jgi:hypothetical protein